MTGPEHYQEAERLLAVVDAMQDRIQKHVASGAHFDEVEVVRTEQAMVTVAITAQAHATLAAAAATALSHVSGPDKWLDVAG